MRKPKLNDYVVTLCAKGGVDVKAVRVNGFRCKEDVGAYCRKQFPDWNIRQVLRLYETDFLETDI